MMKEVIRSLETGLMAEIGLFAFIVAFVLILIRVAQYTKSERVHGKRLPLDEPLETYPEKS